MSQPGTDSLAVGVAGGREPEAATESGLTYQRCRWCGTASFRRLLCPVCASSDMEEERSTGEGVVIRSAVVHRYTRVARNESLIRFPEGFMFRCRVVGAAPHLVWVGARVRPVAGTGLDAGELVVELCDSTRHPDWN
ncbi:zinc ribbon domain-containing protein [Streptomyces sp. NPDC006798]|uniref:Zn-ribbon domain-containing OB-fold protein n=1 Tax=Streptomyces sp. NPDC006798 TaxID=3155462 RepID=UPI0033CCD4F2